jgi:hypothetical protein
MEKGAVARKNDSLATTDIYSVSKMAAALSVF